MNARSFITIPEKALEDRDVWNILESYKFNPQSALHLPKNLCRLECSAAMFTDEIEEFLMQKGIPFDRDTEEDFEIAESHILFRPGETPDTFEYEGSTASVPADDLWDMAENPDIDIRQELLAFFEDHAPRLESLEKSIAKWEKRRARKAD